MNSLFSASLSRRAVATLTTAALLATSFGAPSARNLGDLSIEELMNETVTSVSKREQRRADAAAAISVLTHEDLQRSGFTTVADALRLIPGMNIGSLNSDQWAVSARGFNSLYANKLLVLVDGRAVYTPLFAGVFWSLQQPMLDDVDRIEAIRGPGATVWGANAVNGVINIVGRSARDTQGTLVYAGAGDVDELAGGARQGGRIDENTFYRAFASYRLRDGYDSGQPLSTDDAWRTWHGGFRLDHYAPADTQLTWQADATQTLLHRSERRDQTNVNTLLRWTRRVSDRSGFEAQAYVDHIHVIDLDRADVKSDTADLSLQHTFGLGERHDVIAGLGYRFSHNQARQTTPFVIIHSPSADEHLLNLFVQDEVTLIPDRLTFTAGTKLEHNEFTGWELQPSLRAVFRPHAKHTVWAAVSRAVRTPNEAEGNDMFAPILAAPFATPGGVFLPIAVGNMNINSEVMDSAELGYRVQPNAHLSLDLATFYNRYRDLIFLNTVERFTPGVPFGFAEIPWGNHATATTYGAELSATVSLQEHWRVTGSYAYLVAKLESPTVAALADAFNYTAPKHQAVLRSSYDVSDTWSIEAQLRYVSALPTVPAYVTADAHVTYRLDDRWEFSLSGQNLLDHSHREVPAGVLAAATEVPRAFHAKVTWRY